MFGTAKRRIHSAAAAKSTKSSQNSLMLSSMASLTPSQLDSALMDMLNIPKDTVGLQRFCQANPITRAGKRLQMIRMLGLTLIPIFILLGFTGYIFGQRIAETYNAAEVREYLRLAGDLSAMVNVIQRERDMSALYVSSISPDSKRFLIERYPATDEAINAVRNWPAIDNISHFSNKEAFSNYINRHRYNLDTTTPTVMEEINFYTALIVRLQTWTYDSLQEAASGYVWKDLVALIELSESLEAFGVERAMGTLFFSRGGFADRDLLVQFLRAQDVGNLTLQNARLYSEKVAEMWNETRQESMEDILTVREMRFTIRETNIAGLPGNGSLTEAKRWFDSMTFYLQEILYTKTNLSSEIDHRLDEREETDMQVIALVATLLAFVLILSPIILRAVASLTLSIQNYSITLADRTKALSKEQKRTNTLLYQMLPKQLAEKMKRNETVDAEAFEEVTVYFNDMVGFTHLSSISSPVQVVHMLNTLYTSLDDVIQRYDVYKVETIGDAYMIASGLPHRNGDRHAPEIATMSLEIVDTLSRLDIPHIPGKTYRIRSGMHTGPVVAGIIGDKMPRYTLFGETSVRAAEMEKTGEQGKVQISMTTRALLLKCGGFVMTRREDRKAYGLDIETFWLLHREGMDRVVPQHTHTSSESDMGDNLLADALEKDLASRSKSRPK